MAYSFDIAFIGILSYILYHINKQLALFFDQVEIKTYPKRVVATIITSLFIFVIHWDVLNILRFYYKIPMIYYYISGWFNNIIYPTLNLTLTAAFFYLADFGFENRANQDLRPSEEQNFNEMNLNISRAFNSAQTSLLGDKSADTSQLSGDASLMHVEEPLGVDKILKEVEGKIKDVERLNWAWEFRGMGQGEWVQFDCTDCL